jgi:hypothetical protein
MIVLYKFLILALGKIILMSEGLLTKLKLHRFFPVLLLAFSSTGYSQNVSTASLEETREKEEFPVPKGIPHQLFYLQRDKDKNTIVYELNFNGKTIDEKNPVEVYWIRYEEKGQKEKLNGIQKKLVYGVTSRPIGKEGHELKLAAYKQFPLYLKRSTDNGKYQVIAKVEGKDIVLNRIFVKVVDNTDMFPVVAFIELKGTDAGSGNSFTKRIKP